MNAALDYFKQAELALAAYADLVPGVPDIGKLQDEGRGLSRTQAQRFSEQWRVVTQYNHESDPYRRCPKLS